MKKILISLSILVVFGFSNDKSNNASELEMFLFKIGFESLLKDVREIKQKSNINSDDIDNINKKMDYILAELTKKSADFDIENEKASTKEVQKLKNIIVRLENKIEILENSILNKKVEFNAKEKKSLEKQLLESETSDNLDTAMKSNYYKPNSKNVIISDEVLDKIEKEHKLIAQKNAKVQSINQKSVVASQSSKFSLQVGIYRELKSIAKMKGKMETLIDRNKHSVTIVKCETCRSKDLKKIVINGFDSREQAQTFMVNKGLKTAMVLDNEARKKLK